MSELATFPAWWRVLWMRFGRSSDEDAATGGRPAEDTAWEDTAAAEGPSEEELKALFDRHYPAVFHFFQNRGVPREDARDLTQETFLRVYRGIGRFRRDASFQTWLFQIATNLWCNDVRRRTAGKREGSEVSLDVLAGKGREVAEEPAHPLDGMLAEERRSTLREALAELPPQMRRCVLLRLDRDLKYREIASLMQISVDTVKSQLAQARSRLQARLGDLGPLDL
jgi:RNA polymerase sigma-70 factor (ECF subfamily)